MLLHKWENVLIFLFFLPLLFILFIYVAGLWSLAFYFVKFLEIKNIYKILIIFSILNLILFSTYYAYYFTEIGWLFGSLFAAGLVAVPFYLWKLYKIEKEVVDYAKCELSKLDYLTLYMTPNENNHSSVISFNIKGVHPHDVASILDSENVCVRSGNHCAQPLMRFLGIDSTCRASFYFYNTKEDVDRLVKALNKAYNMFRKYIKD